jgi:SOS response regulatory protein OraA/RecX
MHIEIVSFCAVGTDDIRVTLLLSEREHESKQSFVISADAYAEMRLRKGEVDREVYDALENESLVYEAFKRGVASLAYGACSSGMLVSKLRTKGYSSSVASLAVQRIVLRGYLNEAENAKREAERCAAKLWGESRIRAKLFEKRYSRSSIDAAMFALEDSGVDFEENCRKLIDQKYDSIPENAEEMRKLMGAVCRQGYSVSQIKSACLSLREKKRMDKIYR